MRQRRFAGAVEISPIENFWRIVGDSSHDGCHAVLVNISDQPTVPGFDICRAMLCPAEKSRLYKFKCAAAAWQYQAGHAVLRLVLGHRLRIPAERIQFRTPAAAFLPPELAPLSHSDVKASLSHCAGFVAVAVSTVAAIGIDVEPIWRAEAALRSVRTFLCEDELAQLAEMPSPTRAATALRAWCLKEAALKAIGTGLRTDPREIQLAIGAEPADQVIGLKTAGGRTPVLHAVCFPDARDAMVTLVSAGRRADVLFSRTSLADLLRVADVRKCASAYRVV